VTLCIALWGTLLAIAIAVPLGLLGARNISPHPVIHFAARRTMDVLRAVNEFVFALMFVTAVGLGPFAGMLALGIHTGGVLGKLLSETIEAIDPARPRASSRWARGRLHVIAFGGGPPGHAELSLLRAPAPGIGRPLGVGHRDGGGRWHRLLSLGHDPVVQ
jgi:phosphonate transport system permease protein